MRLEDINPSHVAVFIQGSWHRHDFRYSIVLANAIAYETRFASHHPRRQDTHAKDLRAAGACCTARKRTARRPINRWRSHTPKCGSIAKRCAESEAGGSRERGNTVSREALLNEVWGVDYYGTTRTLDQLIVKLRQKIEDKPAEPRHLLTVHTLGYRLEV